MSRRRRLLFYAVTLSIPVIALSVAVVGYYAYKKVTENVVYSQPFGMIDPEIGWVLAPRRESRVFLRNEATGHTYYDVWVRTNADGFRSSSMDVPTPVGAILAIGDSWTFGTAVDYEDSYPAQLARRLDIPVANMGVPAHGLAQTILLLERHVPRLKPRIVVHVNLSLWIRSICYGDSQPYNILKPCFWRDPETGNIRLITPPPRYVEQMAAAGVYPGGWLTAGHNSWSYYLISRPAVRAMQMLSQLGILSGPIAEDSPDTPYRLAILTYALERLLRLAQQHGFQLILLDPAGDYAAIGVPAELLRYYSYIGQSEVHAQVQRMGIAEARWRVPRDGHYTGAYMRAWVELVGDRVMAVAGAPR